MSTTTASNWRNFSADLTEDEIAQFERLEHKLSADELARDAQWRAVENHGTRIFFGHLRRPAGAVHMNSASNEVDMGGWFRQFWNDRVIVGEEDVNSTQVQIWGNQFPDGRIERWIDFLNEGGDAPDDYSRRHLDPTEARQIAQMLLDAADFIEQAQREEASITFSALKQRLERHNL